MRGKRWWRYNRKGLKCWISSGYNGTLPCSFNCGILRRQTYPSFFSSHMWKSKAFWIWSSTGQINFGGECFSWSPYRVPLADRLESDCNWHWHATWRLCGAFLPESSRALTLRSECYSLVVFGSEDGVVSTVPGFARLVTVVLSSVQLLEQVLAGASFKWLPSAAMALSLETLYPIDMPMSIPTFHWSWIASIWARLEDRHNRREKVVVTTIIFLRLRQIWRRQKLVHGIFDRFSQHSCSYWNKNDVSHHIVHCSTRFTLCNDCCSSRGLLTSLFDEYQDSSKCVFYLVSSFISYHIWQPGSNLVVWIHWSGSKFHMLLTNSFIVAALIITFVGIQDRFTNACRHVIHCTFS